jgi:hypothetical protein
MAYIGQKPGSNFRDVSIKDSFTGDGSTVAFDLAKSFSQADVNGIEVFVDNVRQEPTVAYTVGQDGSGNFKRVTFTAAPAASASIYVLNPGVTSGVLAVSDASVTSAKLNADAITGQTELAEAANNADTVLIHDTSASALKKIQVSNLTAQAGDGLAKSSSTLSVDIANTTLLDSGADSTDLILVYDASAGALRRITQTNLLNFPTVSSVSPTSATSGDGTGNYTFVITGSGFLGATANLINASGSTINFDSQTVDSATQITGVVAKSSVPGSGEPYDVRVAAASGLASTLENQINIDQQPAFSTAAGSLGTVLDGGRGSTTFTVVAADPESGGDVTYSLESGSLPAGCSLTSTSSGAVLSGFNAVSTNTTSNFTIRAADVNSNTSDRAFSITVQAPVSQSFTSSGTFSVPSGVSSVDVLVVAGGGGGGAYRQTTSNFYTGAGGGGAGGLIFRPGFPVTPGGTVTVTVGDGGVTGSPNVGTSNSGQDSVFGTLTAKGGGRGSQAGNVDSPLGAEQGGSGGGGNRDEAGSTAIQPTQPGDSGTYGFGNPGGDTGGSETTGSGGGGAGQPGTTSSAGNPGPGGAGRAYTIADGSSPVYYAGGGGGGGSGAPSHPGNPGGAGQGGGGVGGVGRGQPRGPANEGGAGQANTGGGGGGAGGSCTSNQSTTRGGQGGKGIVIVRY